MQRPKCDVFNDKCVCKHLIAACIVVRVGHNGFDLPKKSLRSLRRQKQNNANESEHIDFDMEIPVDMSLDTPIHVDVDVPVQEQKRVVHAKQQLH